MVEVRRVDHELARQVRIRPAQHRADVGALEALVPAGHADSRPRVQRERLGLAPLPRRHGLVEGLRCAQEQPRARLGGQDRLTA